MTGFSITSTINSVFKAHCPSSGVNVYVVVSVLFTSGLQEPTKPSTDSNGKVKIVPEHMGSSASKSGTLGGPTSTVINC